MVVVVVLEDEQNVGSTLVGEEERWAKPVVIAYVHVCLPSACISANGRRSLMAWQITLLEIL